MHVFSVFCVNVDIILYNLLFSGDSMELLYIYILSDYSLFSDRIGLPLHNIPAPFL